MLYTASSVRATRSGKTYSTYRVVCAPDPAFSVAPLLRAAFASEDVVDIGGSPDSTLKRSSSAAGITEDSPSPKCSAGSTRARPVSSAAPLPPPVPKGTKGGTRTARNKARGDAFRKGCKDRAFKQHGQPPQTKNVEEHVPRDAASSLPNIVDFSTLPVSSSGYEARPKKQATLSTTRRSLADIQAAGIKVYAWDGITPFLLTDPQFKRICIAGAGRPKDQDDANLSDEEKFEASHRRAFQAIIDAGYDEVFAEGDDCHKRGNGFVAKNIGVLMGQGPTKPYNLRNGRHEPMLERLLENPDIQRLAAFQSASFNLYCPKLYTMYHSLRTDVEEHMPELKWNFKRSVFSAAAFNFGPQTVTAPHTDSMNLPAGFCAIHALGEFDSKLGGHLIIEELGIAIEFPAGSCILIPSAIFTHSNTTIQPGETRVSFTQFTSGALFRYADNGYRTEAQLKAYNESLYNVMMERKGTRWEEGLKSWCTFDEVLKAAGLKVTGSSGEEEAQEDGEMAG